MKLVIDLHAQYKINSLFSKIQGKRFPLDVKSIFWYSSFRVIVDSKSEIQQDFLEKIFLVVFQNISVYVLHEFIFSLNI